MPTPQTHSRPRVMVCFGTRPEVVKLAPVIAGIAADPMLEVVVVTTAQHREMLDQMLRAFEIVPDVDLNLMRERQGLTAFTAAALPELATVLEEWAPDAVLVQGDTTTTFCAGLAAFYRDIPVGHVEAGLRSGDSRKPFPEEVNRRVVDTLARWHFCPTERNAATLEREGLPSDGALVTGNTGIDALLEVADRPLSAAEVLQVPPKTAARRVLVTMHRRETQGEGQRELARMLGRVAERPDVEILFPMHPSPAVSQVVLAELEGHPRVHLTQPLDYAPFVHAMRSSDVIVTDSGGIQEEAPVFDVPVLVMRDVSDRPEGIEAGCGRLSGTDPAAVQRDLEQLLDNELEYERMSRASNPYGDGRAAERIVAQLRIDLAHSDEPRQVFTADIVDARVA